MGQRHRKPLCAKPWRRRLLALPVIATAWVLAPAQQADAADLAYPGTFVGRVGFDSSTICTFWTGLGTDQYFWVSDEEGYPLPMSEWIEWADTRELSDLFNTLSGFAWLTSRGGLQFLQSPAGQQFRNSDAGKAWQNSYVRTAQHDSTPPAPVEYVKMCSMYGAGFYYIPGTDTCLKIGGYVRTQIDTGGEPNDYGQLRTYFNDYQRSYVQFSGFTAGYQGSLFDQAKSPPTQAGSGPTEPAQQPTYSSGGKEVDPLQAFAEIMAGKNVTIDPTKTKAPESKADASATKGGAPTQTQAPQSQAATKQGAGDATKQGTGDATKGGETQAAADDDQTIKIHFKVNHAELDKSKLGPPIVGEQVQFMTAGDDPQLPSPTGTRTADLEDVGHNRDAPRCTTGQDGKCTAHIHRDDWMNFGGPKWYDAGLRFDVKYTDQSAEPTYGIRPRDDFGLNFSTQLKLPAYGGYVSEWMPSMQLDFSGLQAEGLTIRSEQFSIGGTDWVQIGYQAVGEYGARADRIDAMVRAWSDQVEQLGAKLTLEGNICRLELPGPWIVDMESATQREGGVPTAAISLRPTRPRGASR